MKEKKKPILLIASIVVLLASLMVYNAGGFFDPDNLESVEMPGAMPEKDTSPGTYNRDAALDKLRQDAGVPDADAEEAVVETAAFVVPEKPTIEIPRTTRLKMEREENSTAAHWYDEDSYEKQVSEENERKRSGK